METKTERYLRWGQARDQLFLSMRQSSKEERVTAYEQLEKKLLKEAHSPFERREIQRRITADVLRATAPGGWSGFAPRLRRMERLGYTDIDDRVLVCVLTAQASAGAPAGIRKATELIADLERRSRRLDPERRREIGHALERARQFAGIDHDPGPDSW